MEGPGSCLFSTETSQSMDEDLAETVMEENNREAGMTVSEEPGSSQVVLAMVNGVGEVLTTCDSSHLTEQDILQFKQEQLSMESGHDDEVLGLEHQYAAVEVGHEAHGMDLSDTVIKEQPVSDAEIKDEIEQPVGECSSLVADIDNQVQVKEEQEVGTAAPQQFIILARAADGSNGTINLGEVVPSSSKYVQFEGADGLTYVFAIQEEASQTELLSQPNSVVTTEHSQQTVPVKNLITGTGSKNLDSEPSQTSSAPTSFISTSSLSSSSSSRGKSSHNASVDGINQAWFTTRDDKNALHNEGLKWKQGQWTKEEVEVLEDNINNYCKEHNIKDPAEVIFERSKEERKDFYRTIALGIQRPLFSVYRRVTRMYDRKNHRGKYTPNEMKTLRSLRAKHGNDWAAIGVALGRSASSVKDKCRLMKDNCNSGKWYPEEEARLAAAVHKLTGVKPSESVTSGLSWAVVADHVGTRSEKQCRTKWLNYLNWKQQGGADWTREDDNLLVERVSKMDVLSDSDIDWVSLSQDWASVRSPQWLRGKWWALKRHIPDYNKLTFPALLEQMKQVIYWNMKPKSGLVRTSATDMDVASNTTAEFLKGVIPVSVGALSDGTLSLTYCPQDDENYQSFEVLQSWTPQILGSVAQPGGDAGANGVQGILGTDNGHIIVQTLGPSLGEDMQLNGQHQVIISTGGAAGLSATQDGVDVGAGISHSVGDGEEEEEEEDDGSMTIQVAANSLVHQGSDQDLNVLTNGSLHESTFTTVGEEIVTVAEFHTEVGDETEQDMMTQDVFEAVTTKPGHDLVMGVSCTAPASSLMTSLKDPILMSSSDVDCEKNQSTELTDEHSDMID